MRHVTLHPEARRHGHGLDTGGPDFVFVDAEADDFPTDLVTHATGLLFQQVCEGARGNHDVVRERSQALILDLLGC